MLEGTLASAFRTGPCRLWLSKCDLRLFLLLVSRRFTGNRLEHLLLKLLLLKLLFRLLEGRGLQPRHGLLELGFVLWRLFEQRR